MEELRRVVVFCEVGEARGGGVGFKVCAVEVADKVLRDAAAEGPARVDGDEEDPDRLVLALHGHLQEVGHQVASGQQPQWPETRLLPDLGTKIGRLACLALPAAAGHECDASDVVATLQLHGMLTECNGTLRAASCLIGYQSRVRQLGLHCSCTCRTCGSEATVLY